MLPFVVNEADQGDRDLNGDGDRLDNVLHVAVFPYFADTEHRTDATRHAVPESEHVR